jgi:hypothetical protein
MALVRVLICAFFVPPLLGNSRIRQSDIASLACADQYVERQAGRCVVR